MSMERLKTLAIIALLICVVGQAVYIDRASRLSQRPANAVTVLSVVDGDTFIIDGAKWSPSPNLIGKIRIMGIDTPEMHGKCHAERANAKRAKAILAGLLAENGKRGHD